MPYRIISDLYGQVRGYGRWRIRREVHRNARKSAEETVALSDSLFRDAYRDAIVRFPSYAAKVEQHLGRLPAPGEVELSQLPVWTKTDQRELFALLKGPPALGSFVHATGGSTGAPVRFYMTRESYEWRTAIADRGYSWAGAEEGRRAFFIWSVPAQAPSPARACIDNMLHLFQNRQFFSLFDFGPVRQKECCGLINRFKPETLVGYSGNLLEFARFVRNNPGLLSWKPRRVLCGAEGLPEGGRETIEQFFGGRVFMSYGSREFMLIGMECDKHCGYHVSSDNLIVEVVGDDDRPMAPGKSGRILVTDLRNRANPFIRFEIGDMGVMAAESCSCGRPFPILARVEGRCGEYVEMPDGGKLSAIFFAHMLKEFAWVDGFQVVQSANSAFTIRIIRSTPWQEGDEAKMERHLRTVIGDRPVIGFERVATLEKLPSGKTPPVIRI